MVSAAVVAYTNTNKECIALRVTESRHAANACAKAWITSAWGNYRDYLGDYMGT